MIKIIFITEGKCGDKWLTVRFENQFNVMQIIDFDGDRFDIADAFESLAENIRDHEECDYIGGWKREVIPAVKS